MEVTSNGMDQYTLFSGYRVDIASVAGGRIRPLWD